MTDLQPREAGRAGATRSMCASWITGPGSSTCSGCTNSLVVLSDSSVSLRRSIAAGESVLASSQ